ncbi:hypothetical protein CYMTET_3821 [Cymbomonas tetramitiformis]|uniref:RIH domain-containing protein n=1 Tax=Cymbomonas tetramitiformis TaxID=36881 RepID=A0AAE0H2Q1_9CHLO|nr:hypothetical protein CYMTET_3821 [Cymbomonas tetramitiformis]
MTPRDPPGWMTPRDPPGWMTPCDPPRWMTPRDPPGCMTPCDPPGWMTPRDPPRWMTPRPAREQDLPEITFILLDLARHRDKALQASAFSLLERHHTQRTVFARTLQRTQILVTPDVVRLYHEAVRGIDELRRQRKWLLADDEEKRVKSREIVRRVFARFLEMCTLPEMLESPSKTPLPPHSPTSPHGVMEAEEMLKDEDWHAADLSSEPSVIDLDISSAGHDTASVRRTQEMLRNLNAHGVAFDILTLPLLRQSENLDAHWARPRLSSSHSNSPRPQRRSHARSTDYTLRKSVSIDDVGRGGDDVEDEDLRDVFQAAYHFLQSFAQGDVQNQRALFHKMDIFRTHLGIQGLEIVATIKACFDGSMELTAQVPEQLVRSFFQLIARYGKQHRWLDMLKPLVVVSSGQFDMPVKKNQDAVMRALFEYEAHVCLLYKDANGWAARHKLIENGDHCKGSASLLRYHISCVRLIAECCRGKNPATEGKASELLSMHDVFLVLLDLGSSVYPPARQKWRKMDALMGKGKTPNIFAAMATPHRGGGGGGLAAALAGKGLEATAEKKAESERENSPAVVSRRMVKAAYLELYRTVYVESSNKTENADRINNLTIWPLTEEEINSGAEQGGMCLMDSLVQDLQAAVKEDAAQQTCEFSARHYAVHGVLPFLQSFFKRSNGHFDRFACTPDKEEIYQRILTTIHQLSHCFTSDSKERSHILEVHKQVRMQGEKAKSNFHRQSTVTVMEFAAAAEQQIAVFQDEADVFKRLWYAFCYKFTEVHLGVKGFDGSKGAMQGVGERSMAMLLAQAGRIPHSSPPSTFESIVKNLCQLLMAVAEQQVEVLRGKNAAHSKSAVPMPEDLVVRLMRVLRALLYVDDDERGEEAVPESIWKMFQEGGSVLDARDDGMTGLAREKAMRVQNKYADCHMATMAMRFVMHHNARVQKEALMLLIALLDGGNARVQKGLYKYLTSKSNCHVVFQNMQFRRAQKNPLCFTVGVNMTARNWGRLWKKNSMEGVRKMFDLILG